MSTAEDYNKRSMQKYGWTAWHLGLPFTASAQEIVSAVKLFQQEHDLDDDGKVGPITVRRLFSAAELRRQELGPGHSGFILIKGQPVSVPFRAYMCGPTSKYDLTKNGDFKKRSYLPTQVVWHWDACLSAESCHRVLSKRGLSSHGCIDNDGKFYQFLDLATCAAWHAGHSAVNRASVGIDVSNAVYTKYQKWYRKRFGPRPILENVRTNGRRHKPFLGYYPAQIETARQLSIVLNESLGIELATPEQAARIDSPEDFKGHIAHYHITNKKWDVAGFPLKYVVGEESSYELTTRLSEDD